MKCSTLILATAVLGLSGPGIAAESEQNAEVKKSKRVCKRVRPTGTHFTLRVCRSQAKWDEMEEVAQEEAERASRASRPATTDDG